MKKAIALGILGIAANIWTARGDINVGFLSSSSTPTTTIWSYSANVTTQQEVDPGDYFVIYDFGSIVPNSNAEPVGWSFFTSLLGPTPAQINSSSADDPAVVNLVWTYNGPGIIPTDTLGLGPFQVDIPGAERTASHFSYFAAQGTRSTPPDAGSKIGNIGVMVVPNAVPEPSTLALIFGTGGLGVIGRAIARRRKI